MTEIRRIEPGPRMSQAVIHGDTVWLAGQVGTPGESVTAQTGAVYSYIPVDGERLDGRLRRNEQGLGRLGRHREPAGPGLRRVAPRHAGIPR